MSFVRCDASNADDLRGALDEQLDCSTVFSSSVPPGNPASERFCRLQVAAGSHRLPLAAVFHAGGVLSDAVLRNQTPSSSRAVMAPKVTV